MLVREINKNDKDDFLRLCEDFYSSGATHRNYSEEISLKTFEEIIGNHENIWGYFMFDNDTQELVGYALLTSYWCNEDGGNVIVLDELYICPINRHKGYGHKFLKWIEQAFYGRAVAITLEVVTTNVEAKNLYSKLGFNEDGFETLSKRIDK